MSIHKTIRKKLVIISVCVVLAAGLALGIWFFIQYQASKKTVEVSPVMNVTTSYWGDTATASGTVSSESLQEVYPQADKTVQEVFVEPGQQVHIGDPLLQYDKTLLELDVEGKEIAIKQTQIKLDDAREELKKLQNTTPSATPEPGGPIDPGDPGPIVTPEPSPTVPPADVTLYSTLDLDSKPYSGSGTTQDPYVFLCTEDCEITGEFLLRLLGESQEEPALGELASPFAAIFEVREENSNYGKLLYSFTLDGTALSGRFQISDLITGGSTMETIQKVYQALLEASAPTPTPTPSEDNYDHMGYSKEELESLIQQKKQEIKDLELQVKQAQLDLEKSKKTLEEATVLSKVDGVVRTLLSDEEASATGQPLLTVSGQGQFVIQSTLSEDYLDSVHEGDTVSAMSYENGMSYTATISQISDYPAEDGYYGAGNPNSSGYEFTAVVDDPEGLTNGMYLEVTLNVQGTASSDAMYLYKPYFREDEGGTYVMKAGRDNRLHKQYLELGTLIYNGEYAEVKSGLTMEDYVAFPYGPDVKEGVRVVLEGTEEPPYSQGEDANSQAPEEGVSEDNTVDGPAVQIMF